jgi:ubiquinone/menaquinone biosynthesis C-methylase UbiE
MKRSALEYLWIGGAPVDAACLQGFVAEGDEIIDGVLHAGGDWYRIEHGILDVLPPALASHEARDRFAREYGLSAAAAVAPDVEADRHKRAQIDFFREESAAYDRQVSDRPFYVASDRISFADWADELRSPGLVCDIGAGTGRIALPLAKRGLTVVATDASEEMLRIGRERAVKAGLADRITFVLADAEHLPFRSGLFDAAAGYGVLHHVPNPGAVVAQAGRILRPAGRWLSYDPHRSNVRGLFDWTMRLATLYQELASPNPLIHPSDVDAWCRGAGIEPQIKLHFFLPPHLLNLCSPTTAERWLRWSDRLFNQVGAGSLAGVIVVSGTKA